MSGAIEAVGVALAVFPLLIAALEYYQDGYDGIQAFIAFRREYAHLFNDLGCEQLRFRQHVESMLRSIVESEFDVDRMIKDVNRPEWQDPNLTARLKERLSGENEYESYSNSLLSIQNDLLSMNRKIEKCGARKSGTKISPTKLFEVQPVLRKLRFVFLKRRWQDKVIDLGRQISRVSKIFEDADTLAQSRRVQSSSAFAEQAFKRTKEQALGLHSAISGSLHCDHADSHIVKLAMQGLGRSFKGTAAGGATNEALVVGFPSRHWDSPRQLLATEDGHVCYGFDATMNTSTSELSLMPTRSSGQPSTASETASADLTLVPSNTSLPASDFTALTGIESQRKGSTEDDKEPDHSPLIKDLCKTVRAGSHQGVMGHLDGGSGTIHLFRTNPAFSFASADVERIISLGDILARDSGSSTENPSQLIEKPSRRTRMAIALTIGHAILALYPTPWLPRTFSKHSVHFFQSKDGRILVESPFIITRLKMPADEKKSTSSHRRADHSDIILSFGILVMELWFGQTIESQSFWRNYCDEKGNLKDYSLPKAALEWQEQAEAEAGIVMHEVTYRCVRCSFGMIVMDLQDVSCARTVYNEAIRPLEGFLKRNWRG